MRPARVLAACWLLGSLPVAGIGWLLLAVSDHVDDRAPGRVLAALAALAWTVGVLLLTRSGPWVMRASLAASLVWVLAGAFVYPTMDFRADALWAGGFPALVGAVTALVAGAPVVRRRADRGRTGSVGG